eukprot:COSAG01_NODE_2855_length_6961_cov_3.612260_1_plen_621_part_00
MISTIRMHGRHFLTFAARVIVLRTFVWSLAWYLFDVRPLAADSRRMKYLESASYAYLWKGRLPDCFNGLHDTDLRTVAHTYAPLLKKNKVGMRRTHGGLNFPRPTHTAHARLTEHIMQLLAPRSANLEIETGASGYCYGRKWILEAIGAAMTDPVAAIIEHSNWKTAISRAKKALVPSRWIESMISWKELLPHITITAPQLCEEILSMPIYGGWLGLSRKSPLTNKTAARVGDLWSEASVGWKASLPQADQRRLGAIIPDSWIATLRRGRKSLTDNDWFLTPSPLPANQRTLHSSTGTTHKQLGALYYIRRHIERQYCELSEYLLGCSGQWLLQRTFYNDIPTDARRATVEPTACTYPLAVKLTGLTENNWADSRARLTWSDATSNNSQQHVLLSGTARRTEYISGMRQDGTPQLTSNAQRLLTAINPHPSITATKAFTELSRVKWAPAIKNFAWSCVANCLPNGFACSRGAHNNCPLCGNTRQSVYHEVTQCKQLSAARRWLAEVTCKVVPQVTASSIPAFVLYGHNHSIINQCNAVALRECFFAQWRAQRNAALNGHSSSSEQVREALNQRLRAAILRDWTHGGEPHSFNTRWIPYATHGPDGPCFNELPSPRDGTIT